MNAAIAIAVIIVAVAFAVLVLYIAQTLKSTQRTLNNVADTLEGFQHQIDGITTETTLLLQKTNDLAEDVNHKVAKLNSVFDGVEEVGNTFHSLTKSMKKLSTSISVSADQDVEKATEAVKWSTALLNIWKSRKNK
jgi:uncharacterized protein YoxC